MRVLVIEDDGSIRETLGMVLQACEHEPILAASGEEAIRILQHRWPDALLLDLTLPGMSGEETFDRIQSIFGRVPPTIVLSAAQTGEARVGRMKGALFLAKPYTIEALAEALEGIRATRGAA